MSPEAAELSDNELESALRGVETLRRELLAERSKRAAEKGFFYCAVCRLNLVTPMDGQDTCEDCLRRV